MFSVRKIQGITAHQRGTQKGAALVISLIILAIVTILGVTSMQSSNMELKLAASQRDRGVAFEAAEAALIIAEKNLTDNPPMRNHLYSTCTGSSCFNASCANGLCFEGSYLPTHTEYECKVLNDATLSQRTVFWSDSNLNVWETEGRHKTVKVADLTTDVKYIVEFLCFVPRDKDTPFSEMPGENNNGVPLFRITAWAKGNAGRADVALQSTYKILNGY